MIFEHRSDPGHGSDTGKLQQKEEGQDVTKILPLDFKQIKGGAWGGNADRRQVVYI